MEIKEINVNGVNVSVTSGGEVIRHKKAGAMKSLSTFGTIMPLGYLQVRVNKKVLYMHRIVAEAFLPDYTEDLQVDHINGKKDDNRASNLRMVTSKQNSLGYQSKKDGVTSMYRGVSWDKSRGVWASNIKVLGKKLFVGRFFSEKQAAMARDVSAANNNYPVESMNFPWIFNIQPTT